MAVKGLKLLICFCMALILAPFNVYADSFTISNIVGVNTVLSESNQVGTVTYGSTTYNTYLCNYDMEIVLDKSYLGYIQLTIEYEYNTRNNSGVVTNTTNQTRRIYVNGSSVHINLNIFSSYSNAPLTLSYSNPKVTTVTANNTNVTPLADLSSIQEIIDILNDIYSLEEDIEGISSDQLLELQKIVANTSLSNQYLEQISKIRQWNVNYMSFTWLNYLFRNNINPKEVNQFNYYNYPIFDIQANTNIYYLTDLGTSNTQKLWLFFGTRSWITRNTLNNFIDVSKLNIEYFGYETNLKPLIIYKICLSGNYELNQSSNYNFVTTGQLIDFIPFAIGIYSSSDPNQVFPFDDAFAMMLKVNNKNFAYLEQIANGTSATHSAAQSSDSANSQLQQDSSTLFQQEDSFKTNMQSAMQNVPQFNINAFGTKFMNSAQWVRTQYERMTNNTPFQHLITFSLLVGLSMILIGKVRK